MRISSRRVRIFFLFLLNIGLASMIADKQEKRTPHQTSIDQKFESLGITIAPNIADSFSCVNNLLNDLISNKHGFFQDPGLSAFFSTGALRLVISEKELPEDLGGQTLHLGLDTNGIIHDTLFLNRYYFNKASREYLAGVIVHECVHVFLNWCWLSYSKERNGVDTLFLKQHCPRQWEWLTDSSLSEQRQHILMADNFLNTIKQSVYSFTNTQSSAALRDSVAEGIAWGGLYETPAWQAKLSKDGMCGLREIDIWARRVDAGAHAVVDYPHCTRTDSTYFRHLNLSPLCQ